MAKEDKTSMAEQLYHNQQQIADETAFIQLVIVMLWSNYDWVNHVSNCQVTITWDCLILGIKPELKLPIASFQIQQKITCGKL